MRLDRYLEEQKLSATEFAAKVPCAVSTITRLLNGDVVPLFETADAISVATGRKVTVSEIFKMAKARHLPA